MHVYMMHKNVFELRPETDEQRLLVKTFSKITFDRAILAPSI